MTPQELAERALAASTTDGCIALASAGTSTNVRWANNTLTTNGVVTTDELTVVAVVDGPDGRRAAAVSRTGVDTDGVADLVAQAEAAARQSTPADDAAPLVDGRVSADWTDAPAPGGVTELAGVMSALTEAFDAAAQREEGRFGYAEHDLRTTYLAASTGMRLRHVQPQARLETTGRSLDGSRSAWAGMSGVDAGSLDVAALERDLARRLDWSRRRVDLAAGRYDTVLPASAVADLMIDVYWHMGALDAHEGRTAFSRAGGGTRVGDALTTQPLTLRSDPAMPGHECAPFVTTAASSRLSSVFDNGLPLAPTAWIDSGSLGALLQTRHSAEVTGLATTPYVDNLELSAPGGAGDDGDLASELSRGLLLTCLWYIREVDPQTLLLTGLTRDGVFLVEGGEVVGAVNNFRFNESPVGMLGRVSAVGATVDTLAREFGDYFTRTRMPALRVADFNMSSVSQAS